MLLKRLNYNFVEHVVLNSFIFAGGFFYALVFSVLEYVTGISDLGDLGLFFMVVYFMLAYYQATFNIYPFWAYLWRSLLTVVLFLISLLLVLIAIVIIFYGGGFQGKLGL